MLYSNAMARRICEKLMTGKSLRSICAEDGMPRLATVFRWLSAHDAFRDQYARAREVQADVMVDEIADIADTPAVGTRTVTRLQIGADGVKVERREVEKTEVDATERARLRIDARKWLAGKMRPKKYGERVAMEHTGKDGGAISFSNMTDEQLAEFVARAQK